jgi:U3 small nucleolar RNA-associated protein 22
MLYLQLITQLSSKDFMDHHEVCIIDPAGRINLAGHMNKYRIKELQRLAAKSLSYLSRDDSSDKFDALFLSNLDLAHLRYDHVISFDANEAIPSTYLDDGGLSTSSSNHICSLIPEKLSKGLGNRLDSVCVSRSPTPSWSLGGQAALDSTRRITIGVNLNQEHCLSGVVYGPSPDGNHDSEELEQFLSLWGEKSQLRRFKDGSIVQSVVFENDGTFEGRSLVSLDMASYLVKRHAGIASSDAINGWGSQLFPFIKSPEVELTNSTFKPVMDSFALLTKKLRELDDIPLSIAEIKPSCPALRYTSTFVPQPNKAMDIALFCPPMDIVIEFESSARWPDDFNAIQEMKIAFFVHIAKALPGKWSGASVSISVDDTTASTASLQSRSIRTSRFMDVTSPEGYVFRLRIHCDREAQLLPKPLMIEYQNAFILSPTFSTRIQSLSLEMPSLPYAIRILKRWLSSHMLLDVRVPSIFAELICIAAYTTHSDPWTQAPCSPITGFLRALDLISSYDWENKLLCVFGAASDEMVETFHNLRASMNRNESGGGGYMFIACDIDTKCAFWTRAQGNEKAVCEWIVKLAKSSLKHLARCSTDPSLTVAVSG